MRPWSAEEFAGLLDGAGIHLHERPGAFLLGRTAAGESELLTLATDPAERRRGLARALLSEFHAEAARRGATTALLEVAADNGPARALYDAAGYVEAGRRRRYYQRPDGERADALVLTRVLAARDAQ